MTSDPFEVLDRQLQMAVRSRHFVRRRRVRRGIIVLAGGMVVSVGVAVAGGALGGPSAADRAISAGESAAMQRAACAPGVPRKPHLVSGEADPVVLRNFAVFRRGPNSGDHVPRRLLALGGRDVLRSTIRTARATDGTRYAVFISRGAGNFKTSPADPLECTLAARASALAQPGARPASVRSQVLAEMNRRVQRTRDVLQGRSQFLTIVYLTRTGRYAGFDATIIDHGRLPPTNAVRVSQRSSGRVVGVSGLVPDVVHDLRILDRDAKPGRRTHSVVISVRDNLVHEHLPRRMGPRLRAQWRDSSGRVLKATHLGG
jgi:hypothetical protein